MLATVTFAMAAPAFYFVPGYDTGTIVALLLGLAGIACWEARKTPAAFAAAAVFFCLSVLSKESFAAGIVLYAAATAYRARASSRLVAASLVLPVIALCASLAEGRLVHSGFVDFGAGASAPYHISLAPASILSTFWFYASSLVNVWTLLFFGACALGIWLHGRSRAGAFILVFALSMYVPYALLPNHRLGYYDWAAVPILMLLIPMAWLEGPLTGARASKLWAGHGTDVVRIARVALAASFVAVIASFGTTSAAGSAWSLQQQSINRSVMQGERFMRRQLATAKSVLVCGLSFPFHPWHHGEFLASDLAPGGIWTVATDPPGAPIGKQAHARPIAYDGVRWSDYDLILVFDAAGKLVGAYRPDQMTALAKQLHLEASPPEALIAALRARIVPAAPSHTPGA